MRSVALPVDFCRHYWAVSVGIQASGERDEFGLGFVQPTGSARQRDLDFRQGAAVDPHLHEAAVRRAEQGDVLTNSKNCTAPPSLTGGGDLVHLGRCRTGPCREPAYLTKGVEMRCEFVVTC